MHAHTRVHAYMSYVYNISLYNNYTKGVNCLVKSIIIRHDALTDVPAATLFFSHTQELTLQDAGMARRQLIY